ncbi:MAG: amino acid ABC transporter substrate-binding protein [Rhodospirillaceae bacterium]|nr:amino acid ABC transporter substrate-binding protein [Rhodospirillaceae bacterium]
MRYEVRLSLARVAAAALVAASLPVAAASADTIERIRESGKLTLGYRTDSRPFSYMDASGNPAGYTIALCEAVSGAIKTESGNESLAVQWVPVTIEDRFAAVRESKVDLLCGPEAETLERRKEVAFSIPVYQGGIGAIVRADASLALREVLGGIPPSGPTWRGSPARILEQKTFSAVAGTRSERWLEEKAQELKIAANLAKVDSYEAGIASVLDRSADVFFADRSILVDAAQSNAAASDLLVIERLFTHESVALVLGRNDDTFRLVVDRALSKLYTSPEFETLYLKWFGEPDDATKAFFRMSALPE